MPAIDELCRTAGMGPSDLDAVVVDVGPGLFTGLRVGIAAANSIALARRVPVVGITSLEVLAHPHRRTPGVVASVVDARRSEVYWATFGHLATGGSASGEVKWGQLSPAVVTAPELLAEHLSAIKAPVLAVGDGAHRYASVIEAHAEVGPVSSPGELWPSPVVLAEIGARRLFSPGAEHGEGALAATPGTLAEALYLRQADVRIGWEQLGGRVPAAAPPQA